MADDLVTPLLRSVQAARLAAEPCACGHVRGAHRYYGECGVDENGYPCLCLEFRRPS